MQAEIRLDLGASVLRDHFAAEVGSETIDHHPIEAGDLAHFLRGGRASGFQRLGGLQAADGAVGTAKERLRFCDVQLRRLEFKEDELIVAVPGADEVTAFSHRESDRDRRSHGCSRLGQGNRQPVVGFGIEDIGR